MIINPIDSTAGQSFRSSFSNISEERPSRMHQVDSASSEIEIEKEVDDLLASQISLLPHIIVLYMVVFLKYLEKNHKPTFGCCGKCMHQYSTIGKNLGKSIWIWWAKRRRNFSACIDCIYASLQYHFAFDSN